MSYVETSWQLRIRTSIRSGINNIQEWARCGTYVIQQMNAEEFGPQLNKLAMIYVFNEDE